MSKSYDVPVFCLKCGYWIGEIDEINFDLIFSIQPLCRKCFDELGIKKAEPLVSK